MSLGICGSFLIKMDKCSMHLFCSVLELPVIVLIAQVVILIVPIPIILGPPAAPVMLIGDLKPEKAAIAR